MFARVSVWLAVLTLVGVVCVDARVWAQEPSSTATPETGSGVSADPGADDAGASSGGEGTSEGQQQRRRFRTSTSAELKIGDKSIGMSTGILSAESPDYEAIAKLKDGDVLMLTRSQTIKLKTELPLTMGDVTIKTENVAEGYPGVYGIWLRKTADGWSFIFNERPDVWGTMYAPEANVAEVPVKHATLAEPTDALKFELPQSGQGGAIKISWGEHEWTAPFTIAN